MWSFASREDRQFHTLIMEQRSPREVYWEVYNSLRVAQMSGAGKPKSGQWKIHLEPKEWVNKFKDLVICPAILSLWTAFSVAMIYMGSIHFGECPVPTIPVSFPVGVITGGILATLLGMGYFTSYGFYKYKEGEIPFRVKIFVRVTFFLMGLWTFMGLMLFVVVVTVRSEDPDSESYCHPTLSKFGLSGVIIISCAAWGTCFGNGASEGHNGGI